MRSGADEARSPKYAHIERERRWLIDPAAQPAVTVDHILIEDRYIHGTRLRLRRMTDSASGQVAVKLTKKYDADDPLARAIVTAYLDEAEYAVLATLPATTLTKRRHDLLAGSIAYSLDRFTGALEGLELAEIEWPDDAGLRGLPPPPGTIREVSNDPRYQGGSLVASGRPKED
jgi:CYTH domain-containing protein